jgi:hypothetical protein
MQVWHYYPEKLPPVKREEAVRSDGLFNILSKFSSSINHLSPGLNPGSGLERDFSVKRNIL